ncbi:hypothetical protein ACP70R_031190 [Stipagrostis hirtigluma subsp. patula]
MKSPAECATSRVKDGGAHRRGHRTEVGSLAVAVTPFKREPSSATTTARS